MSKRLCSLKNSEHIFENLSSSRFIGHLICDTLYIEKMFGKYVQNKYSNAQTIIRYKGDLTMMNTAETARRHHETENRENAHTGKKKFSNVMAMVLGILITLEIMIIGAMLLRIDVHSADRIAMALAFVVVYSGVVAALTDK